MRYKKVVVSIFVMLLVASAGCISTHSPVIEKQELKEVMGGRYNGSLWLYSYGDYETTRIHFTVDEKTYVGYPWNESYIPALDWIKNNTPKDAEFLCWWDYGGMIMGYTERNVVAHAASKKLKVVVAGWDEEGLVSTTTGLITCQLRRQTEIVDLMPRSWDPYGSSQTLTKSWAV